MYACVCVSRTVHKRGNVRTDNATKSPCGNTHTHTHIHTHTHTHTHVGLILQGMTPRYSKTVKFENYKTRAQAGSQGLPKPESYTLKPKPCKQWRQTFHEAFRFALAKFDLVARSSSFLKLDLQVI
jgi:hypothetical protein